MSREPVLVNVVTVHLSARALLRGQLAHMRQRGFRTLVVSSPGSGLDEAAAREGVEAIPVPIEREISPARDLQSLGQLWRLFRRLAPAVTNVSTPKAGLVGGLAAVLAGVPARVYTLRGLRLETEAGPKRALLAAAERLACACAHRVVCVSPSLRDSAVRLRLVSPARAVVLGGGSSNGVDDARFAPTPENLARAAAAREALGLPAGAPVVGFVGRFTYDKGIVELLDAFRVVRSRRPGTRLLLIGDFEAGDPVPAPTRAAIEADPDVVRPGFVADTAPYYHLMDVLALPTHREGFPNAPLEAAAAGKPVVTTTATGAVDSVVHGETGLVVPVGDAVALARALDEVLADPGLASRMGRAGRERVLRDFRSERIWADLERLYRDLVEEGAAPGENPLRRALDLVIATVGVALTLPVWAAVAIAIKLEDGGPVLFVQERVGKDGRTFPAFKFRSMVPGAERQGLGLAVAQNDERITRVGRFARATSVDELPQLLNVLRGEMSVVGPRPTVPSQVSRYDAFQRRRLEVKPGLTGWAQVNGRNSISWEKRIELDVWYVEHRSLWLDLQILLRTPHAMIPRPETHYGPGGITPDLGQKD